MTATLKELAVGELQRGDRWPTTVGRRLKPLVFGMESFAPESSRYSPDGWHIALVYVDPAQPGVVVRVRGIHRRHPWGIGALASGSRTRSLLQSTAENEPCFHDHYVHLLF